MVKLKQIFLDEFIEKSFFRLMTLIADSGRKRLRRNRSHAKMTCKTDSNRFSLKESEACPVKVYKQALS